MVNKTWLTKHDKPCIRIFVVVAITNQLDYRLLTKWKKKILINIM